MGFIFISVATPVMAIILSIFLSAYAPKECVPLVWFVNAYIAGCLYGRIIERVFGKN